MSKNTIHTTTFFKNKAIGNFEVQMQYLPMQFIQNRFFFLCKPMTNIIKFNIPVLSCQQINLRVQPNVQMQYQ